MSVRPVWTLRSIVRPVRPSAIVSIGSTSEISGGPNGVPPSPAPASISGSSTSGPGPATTVSVNGSGGGPARRAGAGSHRQRDRLGRRPRPWPVGGRDGEPHAVSGRQHLPDRVQLDG